MGGKEWVLEKCRKKPSNFFYCVYCSWSVKNRFSTSNCFATAQQCSGALHRNAIEIISVDHIFYRIFSPQIFFQIIWKKPSTLCTKLEFQSFIEKTRWKLHTFSRKTSHNDTCFEKDLQTIILVFCWWFLVTISTINCDVDTLVTFMTIPSKIWQSLMKCHIY